MGMRKKSTEKSCTLGARGESDSENEDSTCANRIVLVAAKRAPHYWEQSPKGLILSCLLLNITSQRRGIVHLRIFCSVKQYHGLILAKDGLQLRNSRRGGIKLGEIALLEFWPFGFIVGKPLAQVV